LIKSISGIRGTIGGQPGEGLTPADVLKYTAAYAGWLKQQDRPRKVVIGRDGRVSGPMVARLVAGTLAGCGIDVVDLGLSTTPTVELAVPEEQAGGGIIITASHNPKIWNALKLLNHEGEFVSGEAGATILELAEKGDWQFAETRALGRFTTDDSYIDKHIEKILALPLVKPEAIAERQFKIAVDGINSTGGIAVPKLLRKLGVEDIIELCCEPHGNFQHNPEPLPENLATIANEVKMRKADLGLVVDPDVDRLAIVTENGNMFGEEYTLVAVADYVLRHQKGNTVSNLSSTRALKDVTEKQGGKYFASAVGEVNVVKKMKTVDAVIGGEGNGGVIYPELHYGRDALVGIALFLSHLAESKKSAAVLRSGYPSYFMSKNRVQLTVQLDVNKIFKKLKTKYKSHPINTDDGLKIEFDEDWVHLRTSNTEPIIRIYTESLHEVTAENMARQIITDLQYFINED